VYHTDEVAALAPAALSGDAMQHVLDVSAGQAVSAVCSIGNFGAGLNKGSSLT